MNKGALTLTIIFEAMNLNRDEGVGNNILTLKKLHRADGSVYTFMSRQALRYAITNKLIQERNWVRTGAKKRGSGKKKVSQYDLLNYNIINSEELDAFGYMFTLSNDMAITRTAAVRLTNAISLEPFSFDQSFNANHEMAKRAGTTSDIWNTEDQLANYKYSVIIDFDKLGYEKWHLPNKIKKDNGVFKISFSKDEIAEIPAQYFEGDILKGNVKTVDGIYLEFFVSSIDKKRRIKDLLYAFMTLQREIQSRTESLVPIFLIGGIIKPKTPLAHNLVETVKGNYLKKSLIDEALKLFNEYSIKIDETNCVVKGILKDKFKNGEDFDNSWKTPLEAIKTLESFIDKYKL